MASRSTACFALPWRRSISGVCLALFLFTSQARAQGANVELATAAEKQQATKEYQAGMEASAKQDHALALEKFRASFAIVASPNSQLMVGRALVQLGRLSEAHAELVGARDLASSLARSSAKYESTAEAARKELTDLEPKLALVTVSVPVSVSVNGQELPASQWGKPIAVAPGSTALRLQASGQVNERTLNLPAGQSQTISLDLPKPVAPPPAAPAEPVTVVNKPKRTLGYITMGVGGVALGVSAVMLVVNQSRISDMEDSCTTTRCPLSVRDDADDIRSGEIIALGGLGVGVVGIAAGTFLVLTSNSSAPAGTQAHTEVRVGPSNVVVSTRF
jgi:hypothetical protein